MRQASWTAVVRDRFWFSVFVLAPFVALIVGATNAWGFGADWVALFLCATFYLIRMGGITIFYHRCFTHRAFVIKRAWLKYAGGIAASMAVQGRVSHWVSQHIAHHRDTDGPTDPHSPWRYGHGFWSVCRGAFHAHLGWMFKMGDDDPSLTKRVMEDPVLARIDRWFVPCIIAGLLLPPLAGALIRQSFDWMGVDFVWGLVSLFLVHHAPWSINSVCHLWGTRPLQATGHATNCWLLALVVLGEGSHCNHHAFERSAKHGLLGEPDLSWLVIRFLEMLGLVEDVQLPAAEAVGKKRIPPVD